MSQIFFVLIILAQVASAGEIPNGTYSLATEAGWTAWFKLESKNEALISPAFDTEDFDPDVANTPKPLPLMATWKKTKDGIEITYGSVTDSFKFEPRCQKWRTHPCFVYLKSKSTSKEKTVLKYEQSYVNWEVKLDPPKELPKAELDQCKKECDQLFAKKQLKKGMDAAACVKEMCKPMPPLSGDY